MSTVLELKPSTIAKLELGPDDVVVVRVGDSLEAWRIEEIGKTVKEAVGDHKVLVVAHNITLEVIEKT
jgi:hypothetical protein